METVVLVASEDEMTSPPFGVRVIEVSNWHQLEGLRVAAVFATAPAKLHPDYAHAIYTAESGTIFGSQWIGGIAQRVYFG